MFKDGKNDYVVYLESREIVLHVEFVLSENKRMEGPGITDTAIDRFCGHQQSDSEKNLQK
jgi:hypothetical protein